MATGGQQNPSKEICQNSESPNNGNGHGDRPAQWTLLPNNLQLGTRSKPAKKQRNKDKSRSTITSQNLSSLDVANFNAATKALDTIFQSFTDADNPVASRRNIKTPVNQRPTASSFQSIQPSSVRIGMENENKKLSKEEYAKKRVDAIKERYANLKDCQAQVDSVLQQLEESDDPRIMEQLMTMKSIRDDLVQKELLLRNYAKLGGIETVQDDNDVSSFANTSEDARELNGIPAYYNDEDSASVTNQILEKMKASQEKLTSLREHQSLLMSMQKKAEDKLAAFQAQVSENHVDSSQNDSELGFAPKMLLSNSNKMSLNGDAHWDKESFSESPSQWPTQNSSKSSQNNQQKVVENGWPDGTQDLSRLHVNLDHIKQRLELLQQLSNQNASEHEQDKNSASHSLMQEELDENLDLSRRAAIEWERKKLKNTLIELQEKQKVNEVLKKQLLLLKDAASAVEYKEEELPFSSANIQDIQPPYSEENIRTLEDLRETIGKLRRMLNGSRSMSTTSNEDSNIAPINFGPNGSLQDTAVKAPALMSTCIKRDNIRKEQRNQFPARRHYEAEGRANEDPDVPAVPVAALSPAPDPNAWENDVKIQEKKRKLESTKQKLQLMQNLVNSIQEARSLGQQVPTEFLHILSSFKDEDDDNEEEEEEIDFDDDNTVTDNEDSQENDDAVISTVNNKQPELSHTRVKECANDVQALAVRYSDNERVTEAAERVNADVQNLEYLKSERERLVKLQEKCVQLQHKFSSSPKQNNEAMRCSGEGGNFQEKKSRQMASASSISHVQPRRSRQENLLTRQNVATVESQNRNNSSNATKMSSASLKKDNINDLSAKLVKPGTQGTARSSSDSLNKYNADAASSFSAALNQTLSLRDDIQHKSVLEDILKHDKNKPQNYGRRDNHIHSNSSVNSEPLDGSSRSLAPDTTVAATWGGSSTQENFEDENEPESIEEQEEEGSNNEVVGNISEPDQMMPCDPSRYGNEQAYTSYSTDSSAKRRDNRLNKYFKSTQLNQWTSRKNFTRTESSCNRNQNLPAPTSDYPVEQHPELSQTATGSIGSVHPMPVPSKFVQQLQQQLDKLNALCRPVLHESHPPGTETVSASSLLRSVSSEVNSQSTFTYPVPNPYRPTQTVNEIMQHYTQQLQLQQQLLLSLSQCYHALYIQQLEIQHLTRYWQQNPESAEGGVQPHPPNIPPPAAEDFVFRPWFLPPWLNPAVPGMPFAAGQVSPMSAPPFLQPSQAAFPFNPTVGTANPSPAAPCALVTGVQPARAVVHPDRQSSETLNNQVPPRTRANNFWDNFRSQSRQNLLSSNTARAKDSPGHFNTPQVRQVHPVVPNESSWAHRSRVFIPPHTENVSATTHSSERTFSRPVTDSSFRIAACRAKKPNWSRQPANPVAPDSTVGSVRYNLCPETDPSYSTNTVNSNVEQQPCETPTLGNRAEMRFPPAKAKLSASATANTSEPAFESIQLEITKLLSQNDNNQSGYLMELLRELRNLKSDSLQRALNAVRELVNSEGATSTGSFSNENFESNNQSSQAATREKADSSTENIPDSSFVSSGMANFNDSLPNKSSNESTCQRNNHNWPPATIIPLGKHAPKPCTGAVKKRHVREVVPPVACAWIQAPSSHQENESNVGKTDTLESIVAKIIQDVLPFIQSRLTEECCPAFRGSFCSKIMEAVKNRVNFKTSPEFLLQLHQTLLQMLNRFSNLKLIDCESELIKYLGSALFRELELYKSVSFRPSLDEGCDSSTTVPKKSAQPDLLPSSSKPFCEINKLILPVKEEQEAVDSTVFFSNSPLQEYEIQMSDLFINMPTEENLLPEHLNGNSLHEPVRGAVSGGCSPPTSNWPSQAINAEEDMGYECEAEAEAEPEVEASTEADLAEADQSPGQQSSVGPTTSDAWHVLPQASCSVRAISSSNSEEIMLPENACFVDAASVLGLSSQVTTNANAEKEICLDDIPTKLSPLSQDELQRQMSEEQESNSLLLEVVEDVPLAGNGESAKDPPPSPYL